jgi:hypothetical protein
MTSHPIINGGDHSIPELVLAKRPKVNVIFNIPPY